MTAPNHPMVSDVDSSDRRPVPLPRVSRRSIRRARRGVAMIEFALVLPILLLLVFGIVEFGRAMTVHQILTNGAREGARRAILPGATNANATTAINTYLNSAGIATGFSSSVTGLSGLASGSPVTVTISIPYSQVFSAPDWVGLRNVTLSSTVVMRKE